MNERIFVVREAITKLVPMLTDKKVLVTQRGVSAFVKADDTGRPVHVNLPYIPDNASEELIEAIHGFLDHEVAHILFTDFKLFMEAERAGAHSMLNIIEDARIEKAMAKRFQGCGINIQNTGKFFLEKFTIPEMNKAIAAGDDARLTSILMMPLIRGMAGQSVFKDFMSDKMHHVQETYDKIKHLTDEIADATSTADAFKTAKSAIHAINGTSPSSAPPAPPPAPSPSKSTAFASPRPRKSAAGPLSGEPEPDPTVVDEEEPAPAPEEEEPAVAPEEEEEEEEEPAVAPDDDEDDAAEEEVLSETGGEGLSWEAIDKNIAGDFDDTTSRLISNCAADAALSSEYLVYTRDQDVVEPLHLGSGYNADMLKRLSDDVDHMVGPLQKDLERAISARSLSSWSPGHRSGRVNPTALHRLAVNDDRVFRRKMVTTSKDVAVELVVDMSGSMSGSKIHTATKAAYALSSVLTRIGIANEVIGFTTGHSYTADHETMNREEAKIGRKFTRRESLYMPILKSFNERMSTDVKARFGWLPNSGHMANNVDGESIEIAARRLMARKEAGKILFVLSDGAPACSGINAELQTHLKKTVENISRTGISVIGIGIESTEVKKFYPKNVVINDVKELPTVVMKQLRALILK